MVTFIVRGRTAANESPDANGSIIKPQEKKTQMKTTQI
jgi:hypothetical protein